MKKIVLFTITAITLFTIASCGIGLAPAWKTQGSTSIVVTLGNPEGDNAAGRAIVGGGGYLYIKPGTVPEGAKSWYGPFFVPENGSFEFKELPAGSYSYIALLYTAKPIENLDYEITDGGTVINRKMIDVFEMSGPAFLEEIQETEPETNPRAQAFASALRGQASGAILYDQTIVENKKNVLGAILEPITPFAPTLENNNGVISCTFGDAQLEKTFVEIQGFASLITTITPGVPHELSITLTPTQSTSTIRDIRLFQNDGKRVPATISQGTLMPNSKIIKAKWDLPASVEEDYFYIYVDSDSNYINATLDYQEIAVEPEPTTGYTINITGLNETAMNLDLTGGDLEIILFNNAVFGMSNPEEWSENALAFGTSETTIDDNGEITIDLFNFEEKPWTPTSGIYYYAFCTVTIYDVEINEDVSYIFLKEDVTNPENLLLLDVIVDSANKKCTVDATGSSLLSNEEPTELITAPASGSFNPGSYNIENAIIYFVEDPANTPWQDYAIGGGTYESENSTWDGDILLGEHLQLWIIIQYGDPPSINYLISNSSINEVMIEGTFNYNIDLANFSPYTP